jgi:LysM repeat protein
VARLSPYAARLTGTMPARSTSARLLAPAALALCAVAVLVVIGSSLGGGDSDGGSSGAAGDAATEQVTSTATTPQRPQKASYTIKAGDTLGAISEQTGIPVDTLQELNPELDPQALIAGQKIKLR